MRGTRRQAPSRAPRTARRSRGELLTRGGRGSLAVPSGEKHVCGRYTLKAPRDAIAEAFDLADVPQLLPRYNIAPTQPVPVVRLDHPSGERGLALLHWGLIPGFTH